MTDEVMPKIFKKKVKKDITTGLSDEISLEVQGSSLEECVKVFDKHWEESK